MIKLVIKDLKLFFNNRRDMLLLILLPIIVSTLMAFVFGGIGGSNLVNSPGLVQAVSGTTILMLLFSVTSIGASLLLEKQDGMLKKLLCAPIPRINILLAKIVYANIVSFIQLSIMFIYAELALGLDVLPHFASLFLLIFVTGYACSGFGIFIASFGTTHQQIQTFSTLIILTMSLIGGSMIPIFMMPELLQKISVFTVNYWALNGFFDIFWRNIPITDFTFLLKILVLFGIGTSLNLIALSFFKRNIVNII